MTYNLPETLLQAIVGVLNQIPAGQSRALLNAIEYEVKQQDSDASARADEERRNTIKAELIASQPGASA